MANDLLVDYSNIRQREKGDPVATGVRAAAGVTMAGRSFSTPTGIDCDSVINCCFK